MPQALVHAFAVRNWEPIGYLIVTVTSIACLAAVDRRYRLTPGLLWTFRIWGLFHMGSGLTPIPTAGSPQGLIQCSTMAVRSGRPSLRSSHPAYGYHHVALWASRDFSLSSGERSKPSFEPLGTPI